MVVIGSGPAGSAVAALFADRGVRVALVDRARFPRPKPCAEYVSPGALRFLRRLVEPADLERAPAVPLTGMRIVSPAGTSFVGHFDGEEGLAVRREVLDTLLVHAAARRGAELIHGAAFAASTLHPDRRAVRLRTDGKTVDLAARLVIGADGLNSRVAREHGLTRRGRPRRVAVVGHATGVDGLDSHGEMHVTRFGYVGLAPVGPGVTNVSVVADLLRERPASPLDRWALDRLARVSTLRERVGSASFIAPPSAVGPFARRTTRATAGRIMLVGDAADFHDPFTGEGIHAALKGAHLLVEVALHALARDRLGAASLRRYDRARRRAFSGKWTVERLVSFAVARPRLFEHLASRLAARPDLADKLVRVTAGTLPAGAVLRPSYVWGLIR